MPLDTTCRNANHLIYNGGLTLGDRRLTIIDDLLRDEFGLQNKLRLEAMRKDNLPDSILRPPKSHDIERFTVGR